MLLPAYFSLILTREYRHGEGEDIFMISLISIAKASCPNHGRCHICIVDVREVAIVEVIEGVGKGVANTNHNRDLSALIVLSKSGIKRKS